MQRVVWTLSKGHWDNQINKPGRYKSRDISQWLEAILNQKISIPCANCGDIITTTVTFSAPPPFIAFIVYDTKAKYTSQIILPNQHQLYRLCGIVYYANNHFVAQIIDKQGDIWYHDGYAQRDKVNYMTNILNINEKQLHKVGQYKASLLIYTIL